MQDHSHQVSKWARVVGNSSELLKLNKTLKAVLEGIQGIIRGIEDQRRNDVKILGVLQDIWSAMQDYVWKSPPETGSGTESVNRDEELAELEKRWSKQRRCRRWRCQMLCSLWMK